MRIKVITHTTKTISVGLALFWLHAPRALAGHYPWELLNDKDFSSAYRATLGHRLNQPWLSKLDGPANSAESVSVGELNENFMLIKSCKPRNCGTDHIVLLYSPKRKVVFAKLVESYTTVILGNPPPEVASLLESIAQ